MLQLLHNTGNAWCSQNKRRRSLAVLDVRGVQPDVLALPGLPSLAPRQDRATRCRKSPGAGGHPAGNRVLGTMRSGGPGLPCCRLARMVPSVPGGEACAGGGAWRHGRHPQAYGVSPSSESEPESDGNSSVPAPTVAASHPGTRLSSAATRSRTKRGSRRTALPRQPTGMPGPEARTSPGLSRCSGPRAGWIEWLIGWFLDCVSH